MRNRSARPLCNSRPLPAAIVGQIEALRRQRQRQSGPAIARLLGLPVSTVGLVLRRLGLGRLRALDPRPEVIRSEREHPGELIHLDITKLGRIDGIGHRIIGNRTGQSSKRGTGREYLHGAIDNASHLAFTAVMADEKKESATAFLMRALRWFRAHGVTVQRVMTDNGSAYRRQMFANAIAAHGLKHKRTRPYTARTNGKAERFIQTSIREWAYAKPFAPSAQRTQAMRPWLYTYNTARPHSALNGKPPISRINRDNVLGNDS